MIPKEVLKRLRKIEIQTARLANEQLVGSYASVFKGRGLAFDEVRMYQPGDDVRFIDWNVTARTNAPHVKVFREEREMTVMMVVDSSGSLDFGTRGMRKRELVAEVSAVLALSAVKNNDRVGLVLFSDDVEKVIAPRKGPRHVMRVVAETLQHQPKGRGTNLARALDVVSALSRRRAVTFVVSDFLGDGYEHALRVAAARHDIVPVTVTDPREDELVDVGVMWAEDLETGEVVAFDTASRWVREGWSEVAAERNEARERLFRKAKAEPLVLETGADFLDRLRAYFLRRDRGRTR